MTVLSVAYALARVSADTAGGAEVVLAQIDRALVARGHRSIVVAQEGSSVAGTLIATPRCAGPIDEAVRARALASVREAIAAARARHAIDVVHLHGLDFAHVLPEGVPTVVTLHLPIDHYPPPGLERAARQARIACVSPSQRHGLPERLRALASVIENGVDLARYRPLRRRRGYVLALGRICPEKGFPLAIDAAVAAEVPLVLAGEVHPYPAHRDHFDREIAPRLGRSVRWIGPIAGERKRRLLAGARCVVIPSLVRETSSLVAMEALASGTPVVARGVGALPAIVEHGRTGWIADDVAGLARGIREADAIDPRACRASAEARFDLARTTDRWIALLRETARTRSLRERADPPRA